MYRQTPLAAASAILALASLVAPQPARAQTGATDYYVAPKLIAQGKSTSSITGPGTVVVKVLVHTNGTFAVQQVVRSTNPGDNAAALEIAKSSRYRPATKGNKPIEAYYDFTLKFTGGGAASSADASGLAADERMLTAGNYAGAQHALASYLQAHPGDARAEADLGLTDSFLNDPDGAVAAFDAIGPGKTPANYKAAAARAYEDYAAEQFKAKNFQAGSAAAKRALALDPGFAAYNTLGFGELLAGQASAAVGDLEQARTLAKSSGTSVTNRVTIEANLVSAYLQAGEPEKAQAAIAEIARLDPSDQSGRVALATYYVDQAQTDDQAGKYPEAAALYEQAAAGTPDSAAALYARAAFSYLNAKPAPDNAKATADANKALALDPNDPQANFAAGIALANQGKSKEALPYLQKAEAAAKQQNLTQLVTSIQNAIKQIGGTP
ncbi:MAG: energy transducer TonB [Vulcanimicrobiaceae bacterium]